MRQSEEIVLCHNTSWSISWKGYLFVSLFNSRLQEVLQFLPSLRENAWEDTSPVVFPKLEFRFLLSTWHVSDKEIYIELKLLKTMHGSIFNKSFFYLFHDWKKWFKTAKTNNCTNVYQVVKQSGLVRLGSVEHFFIVGGETQGVLVVRKFTRGVGRIQLEYLARH